MINLICYPHYTCGGLLCDIFTNSMSSVNSLGGLDNPNHSMAKVNDSESIQVDFNHDDFFKKIDTLEKNNITWAGTHIWPGQISLDRFCRVILVSTSTYESRLYRWMRSMTHYYFQTPEWKNLTTDIELIDKARETAKNYLAPFMPIQSSKVENIEFRDIVNSTNEFKHIIQPHSYEKHIERWKTVNSFLYNSDILNSFAGQRMFEAETEVNMSRPYRYN